MSSRKVRLTVTVDGPLLRAGQRAVQEGRADSLSSWVNHALKELAEREARLAALSAAVADYEQEFGEMTPRELAAQRRADRAAAIVVRGKRGRQGAA